MTGPRSRTGRQLAKAAQQAGWQVTVAPGTGTLPVLDPNRPELGDGTRPDLYIQVPCQSEAIRLRSPDALRATALFTSLDGKSWTGAPFRVHWPGKPTREPCNAWTWSPGEPPQPISVKALLIRLTRLAHLNPERTTP